MDHLRILGTVKSGHRIASGQSTTGHQGLNNTIGLQRPFFEKVVPTFSSVWNGTINVDIAPRNFKILKRDHEVTCEWHPGILETFWLVEVEIVLEGKTYKGFIYYPTPSTTKSHKDDMIEILAPKIEGLSYGQEIEIHVPEGKIALS